MSRFCVSGVTAPFVALQLLLLIMDFEVMRYIFAYLLVFVIFLTLNLFIFDTNLLQ